jgi:hypothetical protein
MTFYSVILGIDKSLKTVFRWPTTIGWSDLPRTSQDLWAIVTVTPEVLALDYNIGFVEGSQMLKSIESMVSDQNPREMLRYLPKDSVFNLASAIDAQSLKKIGQDMVLGMRNEEESSFLEEYANRALNGFRFSERYSRTFIEFYHHRSPL